MNRLEMAVDYIMVSNWSFNACNLLWLLRDTESPSGCLLDPDVR